VTQNRRLRQEIRAYMNAHGVTYTTARRAVLGETPTSRPTDRPQKSTTVDGGPSSDQPAEPSNVVEYDATPLFIAPQ
jgi:hypothetical protein